MLSIQAVRKSTCHSLMAALKFKPGRGPAALMQNDSSKPVIYKAYGMAARTNSHLPILRSSPMTSST
jgi:hypothetical protein